MLHVAQHLTGATVLPLGVALASASAVHALHHQIDENRAERVQAAERLGI